MSPVAAVGGGHDLRAALAPDLDDPVDRGGRQVGAVGEDDDRGATVSAGNAASPQRSDAPRPSSQSGQ